VVVQHGQALVDAAGKLGILAAAKDGGGAGIGVYLPEVFGGEAKGGFVYLGRAVQKEGQAGLGKRALRAPGHIEAELEAGVYLGEEVLFVFEVEEIGQASGGGDRLEEGGGGFVGGNAAGHYQAHHAPGLDEVVRPLYK